MQQNGSSLLEQGTALSKQLSMAQWLGEETLAFMQITIRKSIGIREEIMWVFVWFMLRETFGVFFLPRRHSENYRNSVCIATDNNNMIDVEL